jgi:hypothetical protein
MLDGVFAEDATGTLVFHPAPPPTSEALDALLATIARHIERLIRRGVWTEHAEPAADDPWAEEAPVLTGLAAASVQGQLALGPRAGGEVRRCGNLPDEPPLPVVRGPCHTAHGGFDLDAGVVVPARDRSHLERVCRYALRPPIAHDRIRLTSEGDVLLELRHRWRDGTTHLRFHPLELLERLASLTPRPRINLVLYYGVHISERLPPFRRFWSCGIFKSWIAPLERSTAGGRRKEIRSGMPGCWPMRTS